MKMSGGTPLVALLLACFLQGGAAASLRAPAKTAETLVKPAAKEPVKATEALKELAGKVSDKVSAQLANALAGKTAVAAKAPEAAATPAQPVQHKKLDVGFQDFEKEITSEVSEKLLRSASGTAWNDDSRAKFNKNVTDALRESMKEILKPVKQSIGKTWMALPQDAQKDEYVDQLKKGFVSVFESSKKTIDSHLELSLKRIETLSKEQHTAAELLEQSEKSVADSLINEHCYEVEPKKMLKEVKKAANATAPAKRKMCIQSVIGALAHRLNDTQGLISMSMRFDAGAMSLAQKNHQGVGAVPKPVQGKDTNTPVKGQAEPCATDTPVKGQPVKR